MPAPQNGALGLSFTGSRALQAMSLIAIIGMTGNFIAEIVQSDNVPPTVLVGTITTSIAVLYCIVTYILYFDSILPLLVNAGADAAVLIALIVVAVTVGKPLSYVNCMAIDPDHVNVNEAYDFTAKLSQNFNQVPNTMVDYTLWIGGSKATCMEMKAVWGLSITLCVLFAFSSICCVCLWRRSKVVAPKDIEH
ncbi:MAG: hypothetical protein M1829_001032 [Trizodia sp. TS-e1964]|nr:MAG: hypothetical protein M1829_001032 [Trizodia sp. TS-e1964]